MKHVIRILCIFFPTEPLKFDVYFILIIYLKQSSRLSGSVATPLCVWALVDLVDACLVTWFL